MPEPSLPPTLTQMALTVFISDSLRYALAAGAVWLVVQVLLRRRLAGRRILDAAPAPGQIRREITYSLSTVAIFATNGLLLWLLISDFRRVYCGFRGGRHLGRWRGVYFR